MLLPVFWWQPSPLVVSYVGSYSEHRDGTKAVGSELWLSRDLHVTSENGRRSDAWDCVHGWHEGPSQAEVCKIVTPSLQLHFHSEKLIAVS